MKRLTTLFLITIIVLGIYSSSTLAQDTKNFQLHTELGYGIELKDYLYHYFQAYITPRYHFYENVWIGGGTGVILLNRDQELIPESNKLTLIPVYAATGYNINLGSNIVPFINIKAGYGIMNKKYEFTNRYRTLIRFQFLNLI